MAARDQHKGPKPLGSCTIACKFSVSEPDEVSSPALAAGNVPLTTKLPPASKCALLVPAVIVEA